jgi:hypothetical protein
VTQPASALLGHIIFEPGIPADMVPPGLVGEDLYPDESHRLRDTLIERRLKVDFLNPGDESKPGYGAKGFEILLPSLHIASEVSKDIVLGVLGNAIYDLYAKPFLNRQEGAFVDNSPYMTIDCIETEETLPDGTVRRQRVARFHHVKSTRVAKQLMDKWAKGKL